MKGPPQSHGRSLSQSQIASRTPCFVGYRGAKTPHRGVFTCLALPKIWSRRIGAQLRPSASYFRDSSREKAPPGLFRLRPPLPPGYRFAPVLPHSQCASGHSPLLHFLAPRTSLRQKRAPGAFLPCSPNELTLVGITRKP